MGVVLVTPFCGNLLRRGRARVKVKPVVTPGVDVIIVTTGGEK